MQILSIIFLALPINIAWGWVNQTIDNSDPGILYQPPYKWQTHDDSSCSGGSYAMGHDSCVNATIQCNWVSFYYSSPLWPYPISTTISIDGSDPIVVDLQDHSVAVSNGGSSTVGSQVVFSHHGSDSQLHTIVIGGSDQYPYSVVDSLIFETTDGSGCSGYRSCPGGYQACNSGYNYATTVTITATTTTTTSTSAPITFTSTIFSTTTAGTLTKTETTTTTFTPGSRNSDTNVVIYYKHKSHGLTIGLAILAACVGLLLLLLCFLLWRRHRHQQTVYGAGGKPTYGAGSSHASLNPPNQPSYGAGGGGGGTGTTYGAGGGGGTGANYGAGGATGASYGAGGANVSAAPEA